MKKFFENIADFLFSVLGGEAIINTFWIIPYVAIFVFIALLPLLFGLSVINKQNNVVSGNILLLTVLLFFPAIAFAIGPPIIQQEMLVECKSENITVETKLSGVNNITVEHCRYKTNKNESFGEWEFINQGAKNEY